jgi:hypothetical protein
MSKYKVIWISLLVIALIIIAVILFAKYKKVKAIKTLTTPSTKTSGGTTNSTTKPVTSSVFPLSLGSEGDEVLNLQKYLNYFQGVKYPNNNKIKENGAFGSDTLRVLQLLLNVDEMDEYLYDSAVNSWILNFK